jgi:hypothetical protein
MSQVQDSIATLVEVGNIGRKATGPLEKSEFPDIGSDSHVSHAEPRPTRYTFRFADGLAGAPVKR